MYADVTLKADEFKSIHNALWQIQYNNKADVTEQVELIRAALEDCYRQDRDAANQLYDYYETVRKQLGLEARWSITKVRHLHEIHPYNDVRTVTYINHWGEGEVVVPVTGCTWAALYVAADAAIRDSGDGHHVFIEEFKQVGDTLVLQTGS